MWIPSCNGGKSLNSPRVSARVLWSAQSAICLRPLRASVKNKYYLVIQRNIKHGNVKHSLDKFDLQARNGGKLKGRQ